jgi:hypothetical protein
MFLNAMISTVVALSLTLTPVLSLQCWFYNDQASPGVAATLNTCSAPNDICYHYTDGINIASACAEDSSSMYDNDVKLERFASSKYYLAYGCSTDGCNEFEITSTQCNASGQDACCSTKCTEPLLASHILTPSQSPSDMPTDMPTLTPSNGPTNLPTMTPTSGPTMTPSTVPTSEQTNGPTGPTEAPTGDLNAASVVVVGFFTALAASVVSYVLL